MFAGSSKFVFFTGKGGVGKTSLACATAVALAEDGRSVLMVSTDPASNVGQVFGAAIGPRVRPVAGVPGLDAVELDPMTAAADYRARVLEPLRDVMPAAELTSVAEQLSGACTTEVAAFDEFTKLLTDAALIAGYDHVIFDTAPTGHTIRLLQLPGAWSGYLEAGTGDTSCLGPLAGLEEQRARYAQAVTALSDPAATTLVLVARPQRSALAEAARTSRELSALGLNNQRLAINGRMPAGGMGDPLAEAVVAREAAALAAMPPELTALPRDEFELRPHDLVGVAALRELANRAPVDLEAPAAPPDRTELPSLADLMPGIEAPGKGLVMFMGKGGVGKTTMAAATAVELARRGHDVLLTTTDPAAHLGVTLDAGVPNLKVERIDPVAETARYRANVLATKGKGLDAAARAALREDLRSPCTEEVAVFHAFSKAVSQSRRRFVVMDTAPTGHTLLLLDATGSYHHEVLRHANPAMRERTITPLMLLQDAEHTKVIIVTLPETTPILEAAALQEDLRRAGVEPWAWVVNASLAASGSGHPLLAARAEAERGHLGRLERDGLAKRLAVVPMLATEPVGPAGLRGVVHPETDAAREPALTGAQL